MNEQEQHNRSENQSEQRPEDGAACSTTGGGCPACGGGKALLVGLLALAGVYVVTQLMSNSAPAGPSAVNWVEDYDAAMATAAETDQPVLLAFKASWCGPCKWMDAEVFTQEAAAKALSGWVPVHVDVDEQGAVAGKYGVSGVPTFVALSPEGKELNRTAGALDLQQFAAFLAMAESKAATARVTN